jgi:hypothetical protein
MSASSNVRGVLALRPDQAARSKSRYRGILTQLRLPAKTTKKPSTGDLAVRLGIRKGTRAATIAAHDHMK